MIKNDLGTGATQAVILRLLEWRGLRRAEKLSRLLLCLYENLDRPPLTEKDLAVKLFPRPAGHDFTDDSVVRVSVRQLRFKLQEYFASEGVQESWVVEIPKGEYALRFSERKTVPFVPPVAQVAPPPPRIRSVWVVLLSLLAGVLLGYVIPPSNRGGNRDLQKNLLLKAMDGGRFSLTIVPGDALNRALISYSNMEPNLAQYLNGNLDPQPDVAKNQTATRMYHWMLTNKTVTSPHAAVAASLLGSLGEFRTRAVLRHPRDVTARVLQQNSFAFLGERMMNPIVDLFEPQLTLRCDNDAPARSIGIVDTLAAGGQRERYSAKEDRDSFSYARVALVPNLGADGGRVLLLSGLGPVGTEAAALVASDPRWLQTVEARLPRGQVFFEALVEAKAVNMMPVDLQLQIVRPLGGHRGPASPSDQSLLQPAAH